MCTHIFLLRLNKKTCFVKIKKKKCVYTQKIMINRDFYLKQLINSRFNGFPKVITGIRRCGKSYLLNELYRRFLLLDGVEPGSIIQIDLDEAKNASLRNPFNLCKYVMDKTEGKERCYVFIDEIQKVFTVINPALTEGKTVLATEKDKEVVSFVDAVLEISNKKNIDLYITGSNSKRLSSDIVTDFRDKATNIHLQPLSFEEYYDYVQGDASSALNSYLEFGGMPLAVLKNGEAEKKQYLKQLFKLTYFKDILEHNKLKSSEVLDSLARILGECSGGLLNADKISRTYQSVLKEKIGRSTIEKYLSYFEDAFLISKVSRFDLKGRKEIGALRKYYFADPGLRNACIDFTFPDYGLCLENVIYNELVYHGYDVHTGVFAFFGKNKQGITIRKEGEVDFFAVKEIKRYYIQVADNRDDLKTRERETGPYRYLKDQVKKIVVLNQPLRECLDKDGNTIIGATDFLLKFLKDSDI